MVGYLVFLTINIGLFALFSLGLNLQWGFAGLINFGHVAFMTLGAYTTILLSLQGVPLLVAVAAGAGIAALLGLVIGTSTLRLREDYLAIVTIGTSELIRLVALNEEWLTRGAFGIQRYPLPLENFQPNISGKLGAIAILSTLALWAGWQLWQNIRRQPTLGGKPQPKPLSTTIWGFLGAALILAVYLNSAIALWDYNYKAGLMLLLLLVLALTYATLEFLAASPWGRILKAIREDEEIPRALGKNVFWYKLQAFMLGGAIAGISGAFFAWQLTTIYPNNFEPIITFYAWTIIVLGGAGSNAGTLLGAIIFWAYDSLTRFLLPQLGILSDSQLGALRIVIIGLLLILLMMWRPQGILGKKEELTLGR